MTDDRTRRLAQLDHQLAALQAERAALLATGPPPPRWPKETTVYALCNPAALRAIGEALGLAPDALRMFVHFPAVPLGVQVAESGAVTLLSCEMHRLLPWDPDPAAQEEP